MQTAQRYLSHTQNKMTTNTTTPQETLDRLLKLLISKPEEASIQTDETGDGSIGLQIIVTRPDYGKVCGSKGATIRAIKHIWEYCIARGCNQPIRVTLLEPQAGFAGIRGGIVSSENFDTHEFTATILDVVSFFCDVEVNEELKAGVHRFDIYMTDKPEHIGVEFYDSFKSVFNAAEKANGGLCECTFHG